MSNPKKDIHIYIAVSEREARSQMEDILVLDGFDVSTFATPKDLWEHFQTRPARFIIIDKAFDGEFSGLDLVKKIRRQNLLPYVYVLVRSTVEQLSEIEVALAAGTNDCLVIFKRHDPFQIRSKILVGLQWLNCIDSVNSVVAKMEVKPSGKQLLART
jgi:PleD family two-component response regulator